MMSKNLRQLLIASTLGVATFVAYAQPTTPSATSKADQTQADRDYESAKAACQTQRSRTARLDCLRRAEDTYTRATGTLIGAPVSGAGGSGAGTQQGNSMKARS
jgi:hypothetical protein